MKQNIPIHVKKVTIKIEYNMLMEYSKSNGGGPGFLLLIEYVNSILSDGNFCR